MRCRTSDRSTRTERWPLATAPFRLWATLAGLVLSGLLVSPAGATDFTGFYAGINAGYGWQKERPAGRNAPAPLPSWSPPRDEAGLPPSAARAADRNPAFVGGRSGAGR